MYIRQRFSILNPHNEPERKNSKLKMKRGKGDEQAIHGLATQVAYRQSKDSLAIQVMQTKTAMSNFFTYCTVKNLVLVKVRFEGHSGRKG